MLSANRFAALSEEAEEEEEEAPDADAERGARKRAPIIAKTNTPREGERDARRQRHRHGPAAPAGCFVFVGIIIASVIGGQVAGIVLRTPKHRAHAAEQEQQPLPSLLPSPHHLYTQFTPERRFVICTGKQQPLRRGIWPQQALSGAFYGRCYHCRCLGHSQKFCPLRRCRQCGGWGGRCTCCIPG